MFFLQAEVSFWEKFNSWDQWLFIAVNSGVANPVFDAFMPYMRNANTWAPFYLFLLIFAMVNFRGRGAWWCLLFLCGVSLTDMINSQFIKEILDRTRPCGDIDFMHYVNLRVNRCSGGHSFPSTHAANHFGMATYIYLTGRRIFGRWLLLVFLWAFLVGFAQIYVGVHYPTDIIGGAIVGMLITTPIALFFNKRFGIAIFDK